MRKWVISGALLVLAMGGQVAVADDFSYTYAELAFDSNGGNSQDINSNGGLLGSIGLTSHLFAFTRIDELEVNGTQGFTTGAFELGAGLHRALAPTLDLVAGVSSYLHVRYDWDTAPISQTGTGSQTGAGSARGNGVGLQLGLRGRIGENLELTGGVKYSDFGHGLHDTTWSTGARYYFTRKFAAGIDASDNSHVTVWRFALRYDFGTWY